MKVQGGRRADGMRAEEWVGGRTISRTNSLDSFIPPRSENNRAKLCDHVSQPLTVLSRISAGKIPILKQFKAPNG